MARRDNTMKWIGLAALGAGMYYLYKHNTPATATATVASPSPASDPCGTARRLIALGHAKEAAYWANLCAQGGGTV